MPLCFAYGANMDLAAMARRCPASQAIGTARLPRHRWFVTADGYASVTRDPVSSVPGVLWDMAPADVAALDRFEGVARGLYRKIVQPVIATGGTRRALVYVATETRPGACAADYRDAVLSAARHWRLPEAHIAAMARLMAASPRRIPSVRT